MNKNSGYSKAIVAAVITLNTLFSVTVFACFWHTGNEPTTLITAWFGFTTVELWSLASIKKCKQKAEAEIRKGQEDGQ